MTTKMVCPVCSAHGSGISMDFLGGNCPKCGLPSQAARDVIAAQQRHADAELTEKYTEAVSTLQKLRAENSSMKNALSEISGQLDYLKEQGLIT